jgi:hypothetical protein
LDLSVAQLEADDLALMHVVVDDVLALAVGTGVAGGDGGGVAAVVPRRAGRRGPVNGGRMKLKVKPRVLNTSVARWSRPKPILIVLPTEARSSSKVIFKTTNKYAKYKYMSFQVNEVSC